MEFDGIKYIEIADLSPSQLYISAEKLSGVKNWFTPESLAESPIPVRDFGSGRYTITDGHTRVLCAHMCGMTTVPAIYDTDPIVASEEGALLYRMDIEWCARFGISSIADLADRIVSAEEYNSLWRARCDAGYELMTRTTCRQRAGLSARHPDLFLYGMSADACTLYYEDTAGNTYEFTEGLP